MPDNPSRLRRALNRNPWVRPALAMITALAFISGCLCFYFPDRYVAGVTLFLIGSVTMLADAICLIILSRPHQNDA